MRRRGFTLPTLVVAALDLAAIAAAAGLWWIADAERHGENMPWLFGGLACLALLALMDWAYTRGERRISLGVATLLMGTDALIALLG